MPVRHWFFAAMLLLCRVAPVAAGTPEIEISVDKRNDTFVIDASFEVAVPVRTAWRVLTDFDNMAGILHNLNSSRIASRSGNTLRVVQDGVARFGIFTYPFSSEREIQLEPRKRILARQISGNTKSYASEMEIRPSESGTRFRYHAEMALDSGFARLFGSPFIRHEIVEQFVSMAQEMERREGHQPQ